MHPIKPQLPGLIRLIPLIALCFSIACNQPPAQDAPVPLRLLVFLTLQELTTFRPAIEALDNNHPEWEIHLEIAPQSGMAEKINTQLAANSLPDVIRVTGLFAHQWIRRNAFLDISSRIEESGLDLTDFYASPLEQFQWKQKLWGLPDTAAPNILFYNKSMFDAQNLPYPTDDWAYEDMRQAAIRLTLDTDKRNPAHPDFEPHNIVQWGWNGALTMFWQRDLVRAFGGEFCVNEDCTIMDFTSRETVQAARWWASLVNRDHAALHSPYDGSQTGIPGDPFIAGKAAMGYNGFFAVGQLNDAGNIEYDIVQPLKGTDGRRHTTLSTNGYVISANTPHPGAAWQLVQALLRPEFLKTTWGTPGHSVPSRRSVAPSVINLDHPPANQQAIVAAVEYGEVFKPYSGSAFEVYSKTTGFFAQAMKGEMPVDEAMARIESTANEILARDRAP